MCSYIPNLNYMPLSDLVYTSVTLCVIVISQTVYSLWIEPQENDTEGLAYSKDVFLYPKEMALVIT